MDKNKMLIDATHPEETRVVALRNGRVEEFDFESAARKLLRGNIYLAKVTRVEPSLQAAFIDYGGNRHGFLAFNEIHPDYYQIPVADREALKQEEAEAEQRAEAEADERARSRGPRRRRRPRGNGHGQRGGERHEGLEAIAPDIDTFEDGYQTSGAPVTDIEPVTDIHHEAAPSSVELRHTTSPDDVRYAEAEPPMATPPRESDQAEAGPLTHSSFEPDHAPAQDRAPLTPSPAPEAEPPVGADWAREDRAPTEVPAAEASALAADLLPPGDADQIAADEVDDQAEGNGAAEDETVEQVSTEEDALEEVPERPRRRARQYKIQEVIKRRQIMLVQVVKEERGNKGAALTTYISLAGRYTVLMPNTARGGGISRKITQPQDRKRLKSIAEELDVQEGMGLIIRTAGAARTKQEIKRDYDYLIRLWESVRELTLASTAPCLVYEEGNIIKRAIRDLYSKDFDQIVVAGEAAHREAQDFMEMLMPGSGGQVAGYRAPEPLFARYGIERQLNALFSPYVTLRSGGYIVINQTEALVSVDVNSGKSTREFSIEETALNTNLEAAEEIARQLKLRDLAGLIVVDFIDMEEKRNNRSVERRLKDALRHDRARIQVGRISHFGLLEMSRQRLRAGVLEGSTSQCPHCQGTGIIRSIESVALAVLRGLEDHLLKQPTSVLALTTAEVALYILNHKRAFITEMERRYGVTIRVEASDRMQGANFTVERVAAPVPAAAAAPRAAVSMEWGFDREEGAAEEAEELAAEPARDERRFAEDDRSARTEGGSEEERRGRRRRRRRGRRDREGEPREPQRELHEGAAAPDLADEMAEAPMPSPAALVSEEAYEAPEEAESYGGGEPAEAMEAPGERSEGEGGERRRGRRRGRRGGRARRREGSEGLPAAQGGQVADDADRHEWGIAEVARPGAEQPSAYPTAPWRERTMGLVGSVEAPPRDNLHDAPARPSIVEQAGESTGRRPRETSPFAACAAEAIRLAVALAGGGGRASVRPLRPLEAPAEAAPVATPPTDLAPASRGAGPTDGDLGASGASKPVRTAELAPVGESAVESAAAPSIGESNVSSLADRQRVAVEPEPQPVGAGATETSSELRPARRGWWQRRFGGTE